jgi:hypothetical protein
MSFLNQLKNQAQALQHERTVQDQHLGEITARTEQACRFVLSYFEDLARQLNVIEPRGPEFSLDGKVPWPAMKLVDFRVDARRKRLRDREVFDYVAMGWLVVPQVGAPATGSVSVNFPTDMKRVEDRLAMGPVRHERYQVRDPDRSNVLQEVRYEYVTQTRGSVLATALHERGQVQFRLLNTQGFEVVQTEVAVERIGHDLLDELAKRIVGEASAFP